MKRLTYILFAALVCVVSACGTDELPTTFKENARTLKIVATLEKSSAKVAFSETDRVKISESWQDKDRIFGYWLGDDHSINKLTYEAKVVADKVEFFPVGEPEMPESFNGVDFYMFYAPSRTVDDIDENGKLPVSGISVQDGALANITDYVYMCAKGTVNNNVLALEFKNQFSIVEFAGFIDAESGRSYSFELSSPELKSSGTIARTGDSFAFSPSDDASGVYTLSENRTADADGRIPAVYFVVPLGSDVTVSSMTLKISKSVSESETELLFTRCYNGRKIVRSKQYKTFEMSLKPRELPGIFTLADGRQIRFSRGNLYYSGSGFEFEARQYDFRTIPGKIAVSLGSSSVDGTAAGNYGLFQWSYVDQSGNVVIGFPTEINNNEYYVYPGTGKSYYDLGKFVEPGDLWRTLSEEEWKSVISNYGAASLYKDDKKTLICRGMILVPSGFSDPNKNFAYNTPQFQLKKNTGWDTNKYTESDWQDMEANGAVFLPVAGATRSTGNVTLTNETALYRISDMYNSSLSFSYASPSTKFDTVANNPKFGICVRLVREVTVSESN